MTDLRCDDTPRVGGQFIFYISLFVFSCAIANTEIDDESRNRLKQLEIRNWTQIRDVNGTAVRLNLRALQLCGRYLCGPR